MDNQQPTGGIIMGARKEARDKAAMRRQLEDEQKADPGFHYRGIITKLENDLSRSKAHSERLRVELTASRKYVEEAIANEMEARTTLEMEQKRRETLKRFHKNLRAACQKDAERYKTLRRENELLLTIIRHSMSPEDYLARREIFSDNINPREA
jgi:hypothetical protein